jgi:hypothetical protein
MAGKLDGAAPWMRFLAGLVPFPVFTKTTKNAKCWA